MINIYLFFVIIIGFLSFILGFLKLMFTKDPNLINSCYICISIGISLVLAGAVFSYFLCFD